MLFGIKLFCVLSQTNPSQTNIKHSLIGSRKKNLVSHATSIAGKHLACAQ